MQSQIDNKFTLPQKHMDIARKCLPLDLHENTSLHPPPPKKKKSDSHQQIGKFR